MAGPKLLRLFADAYPEVFFIEIGSNDGEQHDHLRPLILSRNWRGVLVEPVPYVFERLRQNYDGVEGLIFENVAIADRDGERPFFHLRQADPAETDKVPHWYHGLGSFSAEAVLGHARHIPDVRERLVETSVACVTFETLCRRNEIGSVDLILVDTEGHDFEILKEIDLTAYRPRLVIYEHYHLSPGDRSACQSMFEQAGYETMEEGFDTFCLDVEVRDHLTAQWSRLTPAVAGVSVHDN